MLTQSRGPFVSVFPTEDGAYRATCSSVPGISADGATPEEAETALLEMIETRTQFGPLSAREPVNLDPDSTGGTPEIEL